MKLTKKDENEILKVYDTWLHSYLNGDVATYDSYFDDEYHFIGSTDNEEFLNRKNTTNFFKATAEQLAGKTEIRNSKKTLEYFGEIAFITDLFDAYFLNGNSWDYYGRFRFTSALRKRDEAWKFIYQHFSMPDTKAQEGETIGYNQISVENQQLREAVKRRTVELENKNKILEIEAALERVRIRTMAMNKSEELLEVGTVLYKELSKLGIANLTSGFVLMDEEVGYGWRYGVNPRDGSIMQEPSGIPLKGTKILNAITTSWKKQQPSWFIELDEQETIDHQTYMATHSKNFPLPLEKLLQISPKRLKIYTFNFKEGYLLIVGGFLLSIEQQELMVRFANVFEQAHTRFLDLQKAEVLIRETRVELSLERIRSQATAMKQSTDLLDVVVSMRAEFISLGHEAHYFWHMLYSRDTYQKAMTSGDGNRIGFVMKLPRHIHGDIPLVANWEKSDEPTLIYPMNTEEALAYIHKMVTLGDFQNLDPQAPTEDDIRNIGGLTFIMARTTHGEIGYSLPGVVTDPPHEDLDILVRFAGAFDLAHLRFLDLKKAEAQAREAQIELALEKVRSRTMAMHNSTELSEAAELLYREFTKLGVTPFSIGYIINDNEAGQWKVWMTDANDTKFKDFWTLPFDADRHLKNRYESWKRKELFHYTLLEGYENKEHHHIIAKYAPWKEESLRDLPHRLVLNSAHFLQGHLLIVTGDLLSVDEEKLLCRFATVFEQTYTRFLDLQNAEAQAREAQIEAALERLRSRTMAMQKSEELPEVVGVMYDQLEPFGLAAYGCELILCDEDTEELEYFSVSFETIMLRKHRIRKTIHPIFEKQWNAWKQQSERLIVPLEGKDKTEFEDLIFSKTAFKIWPEEIKKSIRATPSYAFSHAIMHFGLLEVIDQEPLSDVNFEILQRFAKVFEQTYTRFLDLEKAEAQARESQIEVALEKVRSRTMAMQRSTQLQETAALMFDQIESLDVDIMGCGFNIWNDDRSEATAWMSGMERFQPPFQTSSSADIFERIYLAMKNGESLFVEEQAGEELEEHYKYMASIPTFKKILEQLAFKGLAVPTFQVMHCAYFSHGYLMFITLEPCPEAHDIYKRFAKVFEQTYIRFLDLQKAEAQARETQIELSLERVRSRALAMHKSEELSDLVTCILDELTKLDFALSFCIINIINEPDNSNTVWATNPTLIGVPPESYYMKFEDYPFHDAMMKGWKEQNSKFVYTIEGQEKEIYDDYLFNETEFKRFNKEFKDANRALDKYVASFSFSNFGGLQTVGDEPLSDENLEILSRFGKVFDLTYTRFNDLQKAEAQAREAIIEAALERLRASTMAMHKSEHVALATIVMFDELIQLGVEFERCGIAIPLDNENIEFWAATSNENGETIRVVGQESLGLHPSLQSAYDAWDQKMEYQNFTLEGKDLLEYYQSVKDTMPLPDWKERMRSAKAGMEDFSTFPFTDGWVYIFRDKPLDKETIHLLKRFAQVFDSTYTRYLDLQRAEEQTRIAEKQNKELAESYKNLQQTQAQLIQAEKMASLGELTAGIAHEIQNPLNFVNNFSDVSSEMIDEMQEEITKGDLEEIKAISDDIKQNLIKISHHGNRASSIVKGMLDHSRTSTGEKMPTDINELADEYLRLAYHGLRAKDNTFNASMETNFDDSIGKINIIPQDIGRVLLNLITNAFQATHEKSQNGIENYAPKVTVSTQRLDNYTTLTVKDNGLGIPDDIKDKIFQPFFTTKPTGQGTGLGLSLAYDIVKAHGWEMTVNSIPNGETAFVITIPTNL